MEYVKTALYLLVFPGLIFLFGYSTFLEWLDRKVYARFQNRMGPLYVGKLGMLQPIADFVKLMAKEDIVPAAADKPMFNFAPILGLAAVLTAGLLMPVWHYNLDTPSATSFTGDLVVVAYLLSLPTLAYFIAGWSSRSMYAAIGAVRVLTLLFSYEVPLFLAILSPAMLAGSWRMAEIAAYYQAHPLHILITGFIGLPVALLCLQAKLERVPFDIPEAETELVGGAFTEYSGKKLAVFRLLLDICMVVGVGFLAALFLGGFPRGETIGVLGVLKGLGWFVAKTIFLMLFLTTLRAVTGRIRIDQMVAFSWQYLAPLAVLQLGIVLVLKGFVLR